MIASSSRTLAQALAPSAPLLLALVIYTGYAVPINYMRGWARWINYIDPVAYGFEALLLNELAGREFACSSLVPSGGPYNEIGLANRVCSAVGSTAGSDVVSGTAFLELSYSYQPAHKWRNVGILFAFLFAFLAAHLLTTGE
jgi:ATP-binding cassette subfamily G (WHITE) protein 2 (PDR)